MTMKYHMTWNEVFSRAAKWHFPAGSTIHGIPRGGMIVAGMLQRAGVANSPYPENATHFIDDIIDSGVTRERMQSAHPGRPFHVLVDKTGPDKDIGWVVFPWETSVEKSIEDNVIRILQHIGEDPTREGLADTPHRVIKSWSELYNGYGKNPADIMRTFTEGACDEMVILKDVEFFSTCEHHMLPFFGKAHVAYIPNGKVIGVSKLARLVDLYSHRLQIQERLGQQITSALMEHLAPKGAACLIEAQHFCMKSRGVQKQDSIMVTSSLAGVFKTSGETRSEFLSIVNRR